MMYDKGGQLNIDLLLFFTYKIFPSIFSNTIPLRNEQILKIIKALQ